MIPSDSLVLSDKFQEVTFARLCTVRTPANILFIDAAGKALRYVTKNKGHSLSITEPVVSYSRDLKQRL